MIFTALETFLLCSLALFLGLLNKSLFTIFKDFIGRPITLGFYSLILFIVQSYKDAKKKRKMKVDMLVEKNANIFNLIVPTFLDAFMPQSPLKEVLESLKINSALKEQIKEEILKGSKMDQIITNTLLPGKIFVLFIISLVFTSFIGLLMGSFKKSLLELSLKFFMDHRNKTSSEKSDNTSNEQKEDAFAPEI